MVVARGRWLTLDALHINPRAKQILGAVKRYASASLKPNARKSLGLPTSQVLLYPDGTIASKPHFQVQAESSLSSFGGCNREVPKGSGWSALWKSGDPAGICVVLPLRGPPAIDSFLVSFARILEPHRLVGFGFSSFGWMGHAAPALSPKPAELPRFRGTLGANHPGPLQLPCRLHCWL